MPRHWPRIRINVSVAAAVLPSATEVPVNSRESCMQRSAKYSAHRTQSDANLSYSVVGDCGFHRDMYSVPDDLVEDGSEALY